MNAATRGLLVLGGLIAVIVLVCVGPSFFWLPAGGQGVALPVITLPGEVLAGNILPGFDLTNTLTSLLVVDAVILAIAFVVGRALRSAAPDRYVPRGMANFIEFMAEAFVYSQARNLLGLKKARSVFPLAASIFLFILVANLIKLVPGFESVGLVSCAEYDVFAEDTDPVALGQVGYRVAGYAVDAEGHSEARPWMRLFNGDNNGDGVYDLAERSGTKATRANTLHCEEKHEWAKPPLAQAMEDRYVSAARDEYARDGKEFNEAEKREEYHKKQEEKAGGKEVIEAADSEIFAIIPFFRGATTDLNLPLALALIAFVMVEFWGLRWGGLGYLFKFINLPALGQASQGKILKSIDFLVGVIEIVSELSRLVSLTFRLFGSVLAGGILLIVLSFLVAFLVPLPIYFLELFVGGIQAYVFATLVIIYASQAEYHGDHGNGDHGHDDHH
jgi:F-type H+-transporting ATPase subunit a